MQRISKCLLLFIAFIKILHIGIQIIMCVWGGVRVYMYVAIDRFCLYKIN